MCVCVIPQGQMDANNVPIYSATNMNDHSLNGSATYSLQPTALMQQQQHHHHHHHHHQQQQQSPQLYQNQPPNTENPRTLYVGNLDPSITEEFIRTLFQTFGKIINLKLMNDNQNEHYCFVEYEEPSSAATAILTMNKRKCYGREIKVNWASSCGGIGTKPDTSRHFHIFVGDLSTEIETQQLREAFSPFGEISDCRVVRDLNTYKSKGYGFVSFVKKQDAENAITNMNGQWIGHRAIRTNWAARKMPSTALKNDNNVTIGPSFGNRTLNYEEIYNQSSLTNCTVYCGGLMNGLSEDLIQKAFGRFGPIQEIRVFKEKGYAFIKFISKEAATNAIVTMHNQDILGQTVKCSWGKETNDSNSILPSASVVSAANPAARQTAAAATAASLASGLSSQSLIYQYNQQQLSYWYPSYNAAGMQANQAAAQYGPAVQAGMQYPFNQYYPHGGGQAQAVSTTGQQQQQQQSSNAYDSTSMAMPISGWNHHQGHHHHHHQLSNNNNATMPTSHISAPIHQSTSTLHQPQTVMNHHYSLQGYQAQ